MHTHVQARRAILDIHTSKWADPPSDQLKVRHKSCASLHGKHVPAPLITVHRRLQALHECLRHPADISSFACILSSALLGPAWQTVLSAVEPPRALPDAADLVLLIHVSNVDA
jgi:hypothetical protein